MDKEVKKEAFRQYLHYFRVWFILLGVLAVVLVGLLCVKLAGSKKQRTNFEAPEERVYDYADVLTTQEEEKLREYIAEKEKKYHIDMILVTIKEDVEQYGSWETQMMNYADDFYDQNNYGYDMVHGDGVLLLDNWYEGQEGSWLSTCGKVYRRFSTYDIDRVLDAVFYQVDSSPYQAYRAYVDETCRLLDGEKLPGPPVTGTILVSLFVAAFYAAMHLRQEKAKDTTTATSFVENGKPVMKDCRDEFIRKSVTSVRIQTSSSSGGGSHRSSGGGGGHRSSSGVSHGGGGRRR